MERYAANELPDFSPPQKMPAILAAYDHAMDTHPAIAQVLSNALMLLVGDVLTQTLIERRRPLNLKRAAVAFTVGAAYCGPVLRMWYQALDWMSPSTDVSGVALNVVLTELVFAPIFLLGVFVVFGVLEWRSWGAIGGTIRAKYLGTLAVNLVFWPATQVVNFRFVPLNYRLLFADFMGLLWGSFVSWRANSRYNTGLEQPCSEGKPVTTKEKSELKIRVT
ncbi:protein Mpv17 [Ixodes scapularis]|uniref:protein Mpv17 n=1 Tax=Ixodes scapularis TaxID=6945 RepID=UPI001C383ACB|nr:protein Mpv17 [Ixodes scapularis]